MGIINANAITVPWFKVNILNCQGLCCMVWIESKTTCSEFVSCRDLRRSECLRNNYTGAQSGNILDLSGL